MDGHGYGFSTVTAEVCADRVQGAGRKKDGNFYAIRPAHCDDDRTAGGIANALGAGAGAVIQGVDLQRSRQGQLLCGSLREMQEQGMSTHPSQRELDILTRFSRSVIDSRLRVFFTYPRVCQDRMSLFTA